MRRVTLPTVLSEVRGYVRACCSSFCMRTGTNSVSDEGLDDGDHRAETIIFLIMKVTNTIQLFILSQEDAFEYWSVLQTHSVVAQVCIRVVADLRNNRFLGGRLFA